MQNALNTTFKQRSPFGVFVLGILTGGIYQLYWAVQTKSNINRLGGTIPTAWWLIVPIANIWWLWRYSEEVEKVTKGDVGKVFAFIMLIISTIGIAVLQSKYNNYK
jgi:hypothetical protein